MISSSVGRNIWNQMLLPHSEITVARHCSRSVPFISHRPQINVFRCGSLKENQSYQTTCFWMSCSNNASLLPERLTDTSVSQMNWQTKKIKHHDRETENTLNFKDCRMWRVCVCVRAGTLHVLSMHFWILVHVNMCDLFLCSWALDKNFVNICNH